MKGEEEKEEKGPHGFATGCFTYRVFRSICSISSFWHEREMMIDEYSVSMNTRDETPPEKEKRRPTIVR